jgi:CBS domain-containing protein
MGGGINVGGKAEIGYNGESQFADQSKRLDFCSKSESEIRNAMICPSCGHSNLPGADECGVCMTDFSALDVPAAQDRVEASVMSDPVRALKPKKPVTISSNALLGDALQRMVDEEIGALLVTNEANQMIGILTERDYLTKVVGILGDYSRRPLLPIMTPDPESVGIDDTLAYALHKMDIGGYRHLPVLENGRPVGIISVRDVIRHITRLCRDG